MSPTVISPYQSLILGIVEGISEYLPISSTGHLVIASDVLGLRKIDMLLPAQIEAVQAFEIVIQGGAILAVLLLYRRYVFEILLGLFGKSATGRKLAVNIFCGTVPVLFFGFLLKGVISKYLQFTGPVLVSLAVGGVAMIFFERFYARRAPRETGGAEILDLTWKQAVGIGGLQCLALWPGTSRSMVTIVGGMSYGLKRSAAAEFSFLLGMPALLAATLYKLLKNGDVLLEHIGPLSLLIGFVTSTVFAVFAVRWLVGFLNRNGLTYFGWYRIVLAAVIFFVVGV
jgi:undecaprenyl-diphosphatase